MHRQSTSARTHSRACRRFRARRARGWLQSGSQDRTAAAAPGPHRHCRKGRGWRFGGAHRRYPRRKRGQSRLPHRRADHRAEGRGRRQGRAGPGAGETRSAGRTQRASLGAGGARRRAGPGGRGAEQFRPSEPPHGEGLHHPGEFRSGESGADDRAGAGRRRLRATRHRPGPGELHRAQGQRLGDDHRANRRIGRSGAGGPADLHRRPAGRARRRVRRAGPGSPRRAAPTRRSRLRSPTTRR